MGMFDAILGNVDAIAGKLGLPAEQVQSIVGSLQEKLAGGGDQLSALSQVAQEHGLSLESLQNVLGNTAEGAGSVLGRIAGTLDRDGDGNPLNDLAGMAKGLFGKE